MRRVPAAGVDASCFAGSVAAVAAVAAVVSTATGSAASACCGAAFAPKLRFDKNVGSLILGTLSALTEKPFRNMLGDSTRALPRRRTTYAANTTAPTSSAAITPSTAMTVVPMTGSESDESPGTTEPGLQVPDDRE